MPEQFVFPDFKTVYKDAPKFQIQHFEILLTQIVYTATSQRF